MILLSCFHCVKNDKSTQQIINDNLNTTVKSTKLMPLDYFVYENNNNKAFTSLLWNLSTNCSIPQPGDNEWHSLSLSLSLVQSILPMPLVTFNLTLNQMSIKITLENK